MPDNAELDRLYAEAKSALKKREYDRATGLLTQILVIDESYKDVPRLLAQTVKLKRRRWYNHPALWGTLGVALLASLGFSLSRVLQQQAATATLPVVSTVIPSMTAIPPTATVTLTPTATPIPLTWKRISMGLEFMRDSVTAFATDKKDPEVIYAAMMNAGVYKTIDGGNSWYPSHSGLASTQVESLLIDSQNPQILYAGTMGGIFKTEDGAGSWYKIRDGTYLLMDMQVTSHLYARDKNGIYESTDQGKTWTTVYVLGKDCPGVISSWAIHPADGNTLVIVGGENCAGVYQSSDSGRSWKLIGMKEKPNIDKLIIGLDGQGSLYAVYSKTFRTALGMYVSDDGGAHWSFTQDMECDTLTSDPANPSVIYCAGSMLLVKRGREKQWQQIPGTQSKAYTAIHIDHPNGKERIITSSGSTSGAYKDVNILISMDGGASWTERNAGLGAGRSELKIDPSDSARIYLAASYFYFGAQSHCTLYGSLDSGKSWSPLIAAEWCGPAFDAANTLYLKDTGNLQISSDGGKTWLWWPRQIQISRTIHNFIWNPTNKIDLPSSPIEGFEEGSQSVSANPYFDGFVYDVGDVIYYSADTGGSWQLGAGSEGSWDGRLFYTDQSKMIFDIGRYHQKYSTDNGVTWQNCGQDVSTSRSDTRLALDLHGLRLYLATPGQGVMISTDSCGSWQTSNNGLTNLFVNTLAIDPNNIKTVYAGTDGGAYISYDAGATWGQVNDGLLGATVVYSIAVDKESNVYAATPYGIFQLVSK